jgi:hypothetical protein
MNLKSVIKVAIGLGLFAYMFFQDKLSFSLFQKEKEGMAQLFSTCFILGILQNVINANRLNLLVRSLFQVNLPLKKMLGIHWIGMLFSSFAFGSLTGDSVKGYYFSKENPALTYSRIFVVIMFERFLAMFSLSSIMLFFTILAKEVNSLDKLIIFYNLLFFGSFIIGYCLFKSEWFKFVLDAKFFKESKLGFISSDISFIREKLSWSIVFKVYLLAILSQFFIVTSFYLICTFFTAVTLNLANFFAYVPFGFIVASLPISIGGLGVGHVAFDQILNSVGILSGASLYNVLFFITLIINLLGLMPYFFLKTNKKEG